MYILQQLLFLFQEEIFISILHWFLQTLQSLFLKLGCWCHEWPETLEEAQLSTPCKSTTYWILITSLESYVCLMKGVIGNSIMCIHCECIRSFKEMFSRLYSKEICMICILISEYCCPTVNSFWDHGAITVLSPVHFSWQTFYICPN